MAAKELKSEVRMERLIKESPEAWVRSIALSTKAFCEGPEDEVSLFQLKIRP